MCGLHQAAWVLLLAGGLNWGLIGLAKFDAVEALLGAWPMLVRAVYVLVGLSALAMLAAGACCMGGCRCDDGTCDHCGKDDKKPMMGGEHKT